MADLPTGTAFARRALAALDASRVLEVVDGLDLRPSGKLSPVVAMPLRDLHRRRDVADFAARAPAAAIRGVLELLAYGPLERVVERLGDAADNPTYDQLSGAMSSLSDEGMTRDERLAVLVFAIVEDFPAAPQCRRLLDEDPSFVLPELPDAVISGVLPTPREVDPEIRERRRERRAAQRDKRTTPSPRPVRAKARPATRTDTRQPPAPRREPPGTLERRPAGLTPLEASRFDPAHPLVGAVVVVEVPFDGLDPDEPERTSKLRPALVVAGAAGGLLVRPLYSQTAPTRRPFSPWRRVGLDHASFIDDTRVAVEVKEPLPAPLGRVTTEEWNALVL